MTLIRKGWHKVFFWEKKHFFFKKILYVIPSALLSFLPYYCHSFRITVIPSVLLSFLPDYCHSFRILSFLPNYYHFKYLSSWIAPVPSHTRRARKMATGGGHICKYFLKEHSLFLRYIHVPFMKPGMKIENTASNNEDYKCSWPRWIFIPFEGSFLDKMP